MIAYFNPKKINLAEFGNYLPHLHWHIMARFEEDSYYPEPMWGEKQRDAVLNLPSLNKFYEVLKQKLKER
jgi:diadenosine tetraphosphate (Ap4A) HIT family hydrolase